MVQYNTQLISTLFILSTLFSQLNQVQADCTESGGNYYCNSVSGVKYENIGYSGSYMDVTSMDESSCECSQSSYSFSGTNSPLDEQLSVHMALQAGLLFFISVFWGFFPVFTAIFTFPQERAMLSKERAADMYRLSAYFVARTTSDIPLDLLLPVLFLLVVYFMAGLRLNAGSFFLTVVTVFLCIVAAQV